MKFKMTPSKLMIGLFAAFLLAVPIITIALPKQEFSENENRTLEKFPTLIKNGEINWDYITVRDENSYMDDIEVYYADHLVARETWVKAKNKMETLIGKDEINDVYTLDGQMIQVFKEYDKKLVDMSLTAMNTFAENHSEIPCAVMLAPTAQELNISKMPGYNGYLSQKTFIDYCYNALDGMTTIDSLSFLSGHKDEYVFYRTDHHWTSLGAYYAYCSAAKALGFSAYSLNEFDIETASSAFRGTLYSKTLDDSIAPDSIDYYHLKNNAPKITMTVNDGQKETVYDSLYVRSYLDVKDKYSSFTGSNQPIITIETDIDNGKSLLIVKDSYAHSLVPFLANHYSKITMVDLRYMYRDLNTMFDLYGYQPVDEYSQILFVYNVIGFADDQSVRKIMLTK